MDALITTLAHCDREISERLKLLRDGEVDGDPPGGGILLGLHDWYWERKLVMAEIQKVELAGGTFTSSKIPRFELIPRESLVRLAARMELGLECYGDKAWNALMPDHPALESKDALIARAAHAIDHASKLIAILTGQMPDDGDDHASAVMWAGAFLCASKERRMRELDIAPK